ncbi:PqqD family protein [Halomonas salipaludis]|uniref:Serine kinase n=1 Tax=Halomonas salipaludis TaxID=2032625 RepID=A0A2A2ETZ0_9GAMM|nr:PqqD family protein [Halomonas salipaludis]PAU75763.1 serine kinase [Halomonas salipaludis]
MDIVWQGMSLPMRLDAVPEVEEALAAAAPGWPQRRRVSDASTAPIHLWRRGDGYCQTSPALSRSLPIPTAASAACSLLADLIPNFLLEQPDLMGLHCGSALVGKRLVLFPEAHRAGKSTLSAAFACAGYRVFGDDVLALDAAGEGMALGIAPRLRVPLPASLPAAFSAYVEAHRGPGDDRYQYLSLSAAQLARHGERAPVGAIVLLEREPGAAAELLPLAPGDGLLQLLCQNFAADWPAEPLLAPLLELMKRVPCWLLRYADPLEAVDMVVEAMRQPAGVAALPASSRWQVAHSAAEVDEVALAGRWRPTTGWRARPLGDELFMISTLAERAGEVHRLNPVAAGIWRLLNCEPLGADETAGLLVEAFPGVPARRVAADTRRLFAELSRAGLIQRISSQP